MLNTAITAKEVAERESARLTFELALAGAQERGDAAIKMKEALLRAEMLSAEADALREDKDSLTQELDAAKKAHAELKKQVLLYS